MFKFSARACGPCPLREKCFSPSEHGRSVRLNPYEALHQRARQWRASSDFQTFREQRQVVEHRLARMVQLGVRQARYFGRRKTLFQALMVAAVANLTLVAAFGGTNNGTHRPGRTPISLLQALLGPFRAATNWCQELFRTVSRPRTPGLPSEFTALEMALSRPGL